MNFSSNLIQITPTKKTKSEKIIHKIPNSNKIIEVIEIEEVQIENNLFSIASN